MKSVLAKSSGRELDQYERDLLSRAQTGALLSRRKSLDLFTRVMEEEHDWGPDTPELIRQGMGDLFYSHTAFYGQKIQEELITLCTDMVALLDTKVLPFATKSEDKAFFHKMKGDSLFRFARYARTEEEGKSVGQEAREAYTKGQDFANSELAPHHPIRLGIAINLSAMLADVLEDPTAAVEVANAAIRDAQSDIDALEKEIYAEQSKGMLDLLVENLNSWIA